MEQAKDLSQVIVSQMVLRAAEELREDFDMIDSNRNGKIEPGEIQEALAVYSEVHSPLAYGEDNPSPRKESAVVAFEDVGTILPEDGIEYASFVQMVLPELLQLVQMAVHVDRSYRGRRRRCFVLPQVLPDVEKQIAQQLFTLGVDMVSVMAEIQTKKKAASELESSTGERLTWTAAYSDGGGSAISAGEPCIPCGDSGYHIFISCVSLSHQCISSVKTPYNPRRCH